MGLEPIVFKLRKNEAFEEFHVCTDILKWHSEFFSTFLHSPEKDKLPSIDIKFKYKWVTKVDEDGKDWMVTACGKKVSSTKVAYG